MDRVFANEPGNHGSIPGWVIEFWPLAWAKMPFQGDALEGSDTF